MYSLHRMLNIVTAFVTNGCWFRFRLGGFFGYTARFHVRVVLRHFRTSDQVVCPGVSGLNNPAPGLFN